MSRVAMMLHSSKGQGITEFAVMLVLTLILAGGVVDFGLTFFASHIAQNAAREGARIAVTLQNLSADDPRVLAATDAKVPNIGLFSSFTVSNTAVSAGASCAQEVTVTVSGTYNFSLLRLMGLTTATITRSTTMRYEDQPLCT